MYGTSTYGSSMYADVEFLGVGIFTDDDVVSFILGTESISAHSLGVVQVEAQTLGVKQLSAHTLGQ